MRSRAGLFSSGRDTCLCVAGPLGGAPVDQSAAAPPTGLVLRRFGVKGLSPGFVDFLAFAFAAKCLQVGVFRKHSYSRHFYDMADGHAILCSSAYCISC